MLLDGEDPARLAWVSGDAAAGVEGPRFLLGLRDGVAHFAVDVAGDRDELTRGDERRFVDVRTAATLLSAEDAGIAAQARAQVDWHARHGYCGVCGSPTEALRGGQQRTCGSCGADHFPRTDPVIIVVVTDGERCLLGQSHGRLSSMRMFSALAGFMDQGESIEEAVRREVSGGSGYSGGRGALPLVAAVAVSVVVDDRLPRRRADDGPAAGRRGDASRALVRARYGAPRFGRRR